MSSDATPSGEAAVRFLPQDQLEIGPVMLPPGWDIARIRRQVPAARLLDPSEHVVVSVADPDGRVRLTVSTIIECDGLYLVLADPQDGWWMGQLDDADGAIVCWGTYADADDLGGALAAL